MRLPYYFLSFWLYTANLPLRNCQYFFHLGRDSAGGEVKVSSSYALSAKSLYNIIFL